MKSSSLFASSLAGALIALITYLYYGFSVNRTVTVMGVMRKPGNTHIQQEVVYIADTTHCEDLHYHAPSNTLFTACEDNAATRFSWFPPLAVFDDPELAAKSQGSIHVIDPNTKKSRRLVFENFEDPFSTHGIDVIPDRERPDGEAVYIFAVNHTPNPERPPDNVVGKKGEWRKARSQIEVFHHVIGSPSIRHIRSIWHPLIRTPNDIFASTATSIFVTNDHHYTEGLMRAVEDMYHGAKWTEVVHIQLDPSVLTGSSSAANGDPMAGVKVTIVIPGMHNCNGMGHGRSAGEVLVVSCTSGTLHIGELSSDPAEARPIKLVGSVQFDSLIDNPNYFSDPFASSSLRDHSGFVLPGLTRAIELENQKQDPSAKIAVMVWLAKPSISQNGKVSWEKRLLFEDDGSRISSTSAAVILPIDPEQEGGQRRAWLYATGFLSGNMIAVKVDL
ncbi:hypothetical protein QBC46DRAFT_452578 [Diplogelasinospora grovesii]|uniref:Serum paraoxonase/arylesterase family protein n=1 Tax=Diplogelasinospora grovesii TaxID=303347 RepID=A0AAN6MZZ0_9PEZI|nr:hypothetical protein QBC46DRAFT_452578 [Diplogelasinospora grovesii]